ncbi:MAG: biopolymer transporter ExbD [Verrucomicrobia bacterium]|nr:biopolymer transporter ExbD [Verrucomicrobiota bacterium]
MRRGVLTGRRRRSPGAAIEMAPLIDLVFILLIFYIVSTSFVQDTGVAIHRPVSNAARPLPERYLPVAISKSGWAHVGGRPVAPDDAGAIRRALSEAGVRRVVLQADREVPTGLLLRVMDTCHTAGADGVDVAALQP